MPDCQPDRWGNNRVRLSTWLYEQLCPTVCLTVEATVPDCLPDCWGNYVWLSTWLLRQKQSLTVYLTVWATVSDGSPKRSESSRLALSKLEICKEGQWKIKYAILADIFSIQFKFWKYWPPNCFWRFLKFSYTFGFKYLRNFLKPLNFADDMCLERMRFFCEFRFHFIVKIV